MGNVNNRNTDRYTSPLDTASGSFLASLDILLLLLNMQETTYLNTTFFNPV